MTKPLPHRFFKSVLRLFVGLILLTQVACMDELFSGLFGSAANTVLNSGFGSPTGNTTGGSDTLNNATDETGVGNDEDDDDANVLPQASIPLPPGLENTSTSSVDMNGSAVSQGNLGSDNAGMSLVIASELSTRLTPALQSVLNYLHHAQATSSACPQDMDYDACVTIDDNGSFKAAIANADENAEFQFYIYNPETGLISEPESDTANTHLVHVGQNLATVTTDDNQNLYAFSEEGKLVRLEFDSTSNTIRTNGDIEEDYESADLETEVSQALFVSKTGSLNTFVVMNSSGIAEYTTDESTSVATGRSNETICNIEIGCTANLMKLRNRDSTTQIYTTQIYYSTTFDSGYYSPTGSIYEFYNNEIYVFDILPSGYLGALLTEKVMAFDVYSENVSNLRVGVAIIENDDNNMRLVAKVDNTWDPTSYPTTNSLLDSKYTDIFELQVLNQQNDDDETDGRGVFVSNIGVTFFDFDTVNYFDPASGFVLGPDIEIANTVSMAVNSDKTIGYVVSSGDTSSAADDIITIIDLTNETIKTDMGNNGVISLSDYLPGKTVNDLSPRTITYFTQDDGATNYLLITLGNTEDAFRDSAIVIEL